ncbi:hypothetical protein ACIHDR_24485 [Nocardia sp. NPDC052278]|uniref:hypothetical protein n=1 Tax=unclassified Nocardia TaxID=2637762 RepID=UPI0036A5DCCC
MIVGRDRSGLPLTRLQVRDELIVIDAAALRFDRSEATAILVTHNSLRLNSMDIQRLQESTEGWPAALQLAYLSLWVREDPGTFIANLTGRYHAIGEYLAENVLNSLEPELLEFLHATSITVRVCVVLANALAGRADGQEMLEQIADRNLFLLRLDEDDEWFGYHRLFADYLQRRLIRSDPTRVADLHQRAATWFADHDLLSEAVDHALSARDPQRAVDIVEARSVGLIGHSRMATFLGLVAKLPAAHTESRPASNCVWPGRMSVCNATNSCASRCDGPIPRSRPRNCGQKMSMRFAPRP